MASRSFWLRARSSRTISFMVVYRGSHGRQTVGIVTDESPRPRSGERGYDSVNSVVNAKSGGKLVLSIRLVHGLLKEPPLGPVDGRKERIAIDFRLDVRHIEAVGSRKGELVDLSAADDKDFGVGSGK